MIGSIEIKICAQRIVLSSTMDSSLYSSTLNRLISLDYYCIKIRSQRIILRKIRKYQAIKITVPLGNKAEQSQSRNGWQGTGNINLKTGTELPGSIHQCSFLKLYRYSSEKVQHQHDIVYRYCGRKHHRPDCIHQV